MRIACVVALVAGLTFQPASAQSEDFPQPDSLRPAIEFWKRVYTEADTKSGFLHDSLHLEVVYEHLKFGDGVSSRQRRRVTDEARRKYRQILNRLAQGARSDLSDEERRVLQLWPDGTSAKEFSDAAHRLRFQLGQSDRFLAGLRRSERWMPYIEAVMRERGLPLELAVLPHVESSFEPTAYSRVGAAGLWQFTRSTGLRYMRIDHIVDERRDPFMSTIAAARLLEDNYAVIQSWPLALTAYNHGLAGMRRASEQLGTRDIGKVVAEYRGRTFGFASRNFYAAFAAALEIDRDPERYFGEIDYDAPLETTIIETEDYLDAATVAAAAGISVAELRSYNPALMDTVWAGDKLIPRDFPLRVPSRLAQPTLAALAAIPDAQRFARQYPDLQHRVVRGDTLSEIARRYDVSVDSLVRANGLRSGNFIRIGQVLNLPVDAGTAALASTGPDGGAYTVRRGDTMAVIARRFGISTQTLLSANGLSDANRIYAGQSLQIPGSSPAQSAGSESRPAPEPELVAAAVQASQPQTQTTQTNPESLLQPLIASGFAVLQQIVNTAAAAEAPAASIDLSADPADYSVAADGTIEVQAHETLGHYADWLGIPTQTLRDINGLRYGTAVNYGQRIRLQFSNIDAETFESRRMGYQQQIQEDFFSVYHIEDVTEHVVRSGESLWILSQRRYNVPVWLLRQYNPDVDFDRVSPGTVVRFPTLRKISDDA
jgi:membrane-bound lytic murein transglycosylase D